MSDRPACYPRPAPSARLPNLDVITSPVPAGIFNSPVDGRHVLCLHLGDPVPVSYRVPRGERQGVRLHGQFCVVPAGSSTRWTVSLPATSLLLRLQMSQLRETAEAMGHGAGVDLAPSIHIRDPQIERIGWMMQAEERDGSPNGQLFADSLASALAARLIALQATPSTTTPTSSALPAWRLRRVLAYIDENLATDLGLAELAHVAGFSASHFKVLFARAVGMPVHRFVIERRVERARQRLLHDDASLIEIALDTGFAHASHMARCMRRVLGVTPSQIAKSRQA